MNIKQVAQVIKMAEEAERNKESFVTSALAARASKAAEAYPYDTSLITASQVLSKMAEKKPFITRAELTNIYNKLTSSNSKLSEVFSNEINKPKLLQPKIANSQNYTESFDDFKAVADPVLSNALSGMFEGEYRVYSNDTANKAIKVANASLVEMDLEPKKISVFAGQEDIILCQATYETPRGYSNVIIPVEIKSGKALFPNMFLGLNLFIDLKQDLLRDHIISTAGKSYQVDGDGLLRVLSSIKNKDLKKVSSDVEMAFIRAKTAKLEFTPNAMFSDSAGIIGMKVADAFPEEIKDPILPKSEEHFEFEKRVTSADGAARFLYGNNVVNLGRDIIIRKMAEFGHKNIQVKVADCNEKYINYAVSTGIGSAMIAPVHVANGNVFEPRVVVSSGDIKEFSKDGINELLQTSKPDKRAMAVASTSAGLKSSELVQQVKDAIQDGNYLKAEDAINVLADKDPHACKVATAILITSLGTKSEEVKKVASAKVNDIPYLNNYRIFYPE